MAGKQVTKEGVNPPKPAKPWWQSVRFKTMLIILIMVIPLILTGASSIVYYQDVIRHRINDDTLSTAKTVSSLTSFYMETSQLYLAGISNRPTLVEAIKSDDKAVLHSTAVFANATNRINSVYFVDANGTVLESTPELSSLIGSNFRNRSYISSVLATGEPTMGDGELGHYGGSPVVPLALPIKNNNTVIGAIVGTVDMTEFARTLTGIVITTPRQVYVVNRTGHVVAHSNPVYMADMHDFSLVPAVQRLLHGETGIGEYNNPIYNETVLGAYVPVEPEGWGVVVSYPRDVAYQPVWNTTMPLIALLTAFTILALGIGLYIGSDISTPIVNLSLATREAFKKADYKKLLPLTRKDEIGDLGRSFDDMVETVKQSEENIIAARHEAERERERAVEETRRAELYLDLMGHDINNMLQAGMGFLEMSLGTEGKCPEEKEYIGKALKAMQNGSSLIENVRKLQKVETHALNQYPIDVCKLLADVRSDFLKVPNREVTINLTHYCECIVNANELLKDVFTNLVGNAIKHSTGPITVDISVTELFQDGKKYCKVSVEDNGPGIPPDLKSRLFTRFQRGTTKAQGKGIGLYLVKTLVEDFHGKIFAEDRVKGDYSKGARFMIILPVADQGLIS